jgi:hypothetical protein
MWSCARPSTFPDQAYRCAREPQCGPVRPKATCRREEGMMNRLRTCADVLAALLLAGCAATAGHG